MPQPKTVVSNKKVTWCPSHSGVRSIRSGCAFPMRGAFGAVLGTTTRASLRDQVVRKDALGKRIHVRELSMAYLLGDEHVAHEEHCKKTSKHSAAYRDRGNGFYDIGILHGENECC